MSATTGACVKCLDENALDCDGDAPAKSLSCAYFYGLSGNGTCVACTQTDADGAQVCARCNG